MFFSIQKLSFLVSLTSARCTSYDDPIIKILNKFKAFILFFKCNNLIFTTTKKLLENIVKKLWETI
jgi:hypothetical protein